VTDAVFEVPLYDAVSVAAWSVVTVPPAAVKFAVLRPVATVTLAGTVTAPLLLDSATAAPPDGAALVNVTVQLDVPLLAIEAGLQLSALTWTGALAVTVVVFETLFAVV
jgi:hypothetical protein